MDQNCSNFAGQNEFNMETMILTSDKKSEMNLMAEIAHKFGIKIKKLSAADLEDIGLLKAIKDGDTGEYIDTYKFIESLRKK